jgi:antitoxin (DNA-binding transcriptional repressor) of toxin-antitoxin stability system
LQTALPRTKFTGLSPRGERCVRSTSTRPLSRLVEAAARGEPFIIAKAGKPLVKVVPLEAPGRRPSRLGGLEGRFTVPDDFDTMFADEIRTMFEGDER